MLLILKYKAINLLLLYIVTLLKHIKTHLHICTLLGYYTVYGGKFLPTFWYNPVVPSSIVKKFCISQKRAHLIYLVAVA
jgi:hypothetical protein